MSLHDYDLYDALGQGFSGTVHRAVHRPTKTTVALKQVRTSDLRMVRAVEQEVRAMARVTHPHLLAIYDHGRLVDDDGLWMALEYAGGGSMEDWLPADWSELWEVLDDLLHGLAHAHARGLVHRDLKPANLLLARPSDASPGVKIGDFGLTTLRDEDPAVRRGGTPRYMPPEQWRGSPPTPAADLYALGCILWSWITGTPPFSGDVRALQRQHYLEPPPTLRPRFGVPEPVEGLLRDLLAKEPDARPPTAGDVRRRLQGTSRRRAVRQLLRPTPTVPPVPPGMGMALLSVRDHAVVGRDAARRELVATLERVLKEGRPHLQLVSGPPGVGKTRMARWIAESAAEMGALRLLTSPTVAEAQEAADAGPVAALFLDVNPRVEGRLQALLHTPSAVLMVACAPSSWRSRSLEALDRVHRLELGPMKPTPFRWFLQSQLGLSPDSARRLENQGQGIPGIALAWVRELAARGKLRAGPDGFEISDGPLPDPPPLHDEQSRLVKLLCAAAGQEARRAIRVATLIGTDVAEDAWEEALRRLDLPLPEGLLAELASAGLLLRDAKGWRWSSQAARAAARGERVRTAEWRAAADSLDRLAPSAERRIRAGLARLAAGDVYAARQQLLVQYPLKMAVMESAREVVEALRPHLHDASPTERVAYRRLELVVALNLGSLQAAAPHAETLQELLGTSQHPGPLREACAPLNRHRALETAAIVLCHLGRDEQAAALVEGIPESPDVLRILASIARARGDIAAAHALALRAYEEDTEGNRSSLQASVANDLGTYASALGDIAAAERWFRRSVEHAHEDTAFTQLLNVAAVLVAQGRARDAVRPARRALMLAERAGRLVPHAYVIHAIVAALAGHTADVRRYGDTALAMTRNDPLRAIPPLAAAVREASSDDPVIQRFLDAMVPLLP